MSRKPESSARTAPPAYEEYEPPPRRRGCWPAIMLFAILTMLGGGILAALLGLVSEPNEIRISAAVDQPAVAANMPFTITVDVENVDLSTVTLKAVGLDDELLAGAAVVSIDPATRPAQDRSYPLLGRWTEYPLARRLLGGDSLTITIMLNATTPGVYSGDVSVWVEDNLLGISTSRARRATIEFEVQ